MSQLTIKLSDKADALIAQLQKQIFNRRRKKISAAGVVETLVESGAKSQSDKRFATSWTNLIADIEKAAKLANAHGAKPANLSDEEWAMVLSHRSRSAAAPASRARPPKKAAASASGTASTTAGISATVNPRKRSASSAPARRRSKVLGRSRKAATAAEQQPSANGAPAVSAAQG